MRGYTLLIAVVSVYLIFLGFRAFYRPNVSDVEISNKIEYIVYADGRYWTVNPDGYLIGLASLEDLSEFAVVTGVDLEEIRVSSEDLDLMRKIKRILHNPVTSEVSLKGKYVITIKGIVLYFQRWEDLLDYYDAFTDRIERLAPESKFFLHSSGKLVGLRGD